MRRRFGTAGTAGGNPRGGFNFGGRRVRAAGIPGSRFTREGAVRFFEFRLADVFEEPGAVGSPVQRNVDRPRFGEDLRIFYGRFVLNRVVIGHAVALDYMERAAVEIARHIKPGFVIVVGDVHHKSVAIPVAARIAHPEIGVGGVRRTVRVNHAVVKLPLEGHRDQLRRLENLEREIKVHDARDAGYVAFRERVGRLAVPEIFGPLLRSGGLIGNLAAGDYRASRDHVEAGDVILQVGRGTTFGLPDALQVRFAVGRARKG